MKYSKPCSLGPALKQTGLAHYKYFFYQTCSKSLDSPHVLPTRAAYCNSWSSLSVPNTMTFIKLWQEVIESENMPLMPLPWSPFLSFSFLGSPPIWSDKFWELGSIPGTFLPGTKSKPAWHREPGLSFSLLCFNTSLRQCKKLTCHPGSYLWYRAQHQNCSWPLCLLGRSPLGEEGTIEWGLASALLPRPGHKALQEHLAPHHHCPGTAGSHTGAGQQSCWRPPGQVSHTLSLASGD